MTVMKIKRRKKTSAATAQVESAPQKLSEFEVVESGIGGHLYSDSKIHKPTKTVTFDLSSNLRLEALKKATKGDNSVVARAGLMRLERLSEAKQAELLKQAYVGRGFKAQEALNNMTPQDKKKLRKFPANRTLGMTPSDHLLVEALTKALKTEVSMLYRAGLIALEQMEETELKVLVSSIPRKKRGAPKRKLD